MQPCKRNNGNFGLESRRKIFSSLLEYFANKSRYDRIAVVVVPQMVIDLHLNTLLLANVVRLS